VGDETGDVATNPAPMKHRRERSLTALVVLEAIALFVVAPLAAKGVAPFAVDVAIAIAIVAAVLAVVWGNRAAVAAVVLAAVVELLATALRVARPSEGTEVLDVAAALILLIALTVVLVIAVFGPGRVTIHRILGAVAIYLNTAAAFALAYRIIDVLGAAAFTPPAVLSAHHAIPSLIYFSFATLTTSGYGDIVPLDPFARSLANLEAVIGQLYPATLLARLITLELETRRRPQG
jgi:hypothetical protein